VIGTEEVIRRRADHFFLKIIDLDTSVGSTHKISIPTVWKEGKTEGHIGRLLVNSCRGLQCSVWGEGVKWTEIGESGREKVVRTSTSHRGAT